MQNGITCNMNKQDSVIRIVLATALLFLAVYMTCYLLLLPSLALYYTGITKYCFTYSLFNINTRFSKENYYLSFLPKNNPSSVFMFNETENLVFKNQSAAVLFPEVVSAKCINITTCKNIIEHSDSYTIMLEHNEKFYQITLQGIQKENLLLAYLTDVTQIIHLNKEIESTQKEIIYAMGEIGETRSKETGNHVKRVALYSRELALLCGLSLEEANKIHMASPMHDIGKVGIPDAILNAPRKLNKDEFKIMQTHAQLGYDMLKNSNKPILQAAAIVANEHHEKFDGSGYPNALSGDSIHIYGRITALADVFDALGSERVYKKAWELEKILALFKEESGKHFDPKLIKLFLANIDTFLKIRDKFKD